MTMEGWIRKRITDTQQPLVEPLAMPTEVLPAIEALGDENGTPVIAPELDSGHTVMLTCLIALPTIFVCASCRSVFALLLYCKAQ